MAAVAPIYVHSGLVGDQAVSLLSALTNSATVATDGTMSPVSSPAPGVTKWADKRDGIPSCYPTFIFSLRDANEQSKAFRMKAKWDFPVPESDMGPGSNGLTPGPAPAYRLTGALECVIPERATVEDRRIFLSYIISCLVVKLQASDLAPTQVTGSPIAGAMLDLEAPW